jgi:hypothetical protein
MQISIDSFDGLRKMKPERQVEAAELMVAMNKFTISYSPPASLLQSA